MATEYKLNPDYVKARVTEHKTVIEQDGKGNFLDVAIGVIQRRLEKDPLRYRDYGPYWWALKKVLIAHGVYDSDVMDETMAKEYTYETEEQTVTAADEFRSDYLKQYLIYTNRFDFVNEDGDIEEYLLSDPDMENMAIFRDK